MARPLPLLHWHRITLLKPRPRVDVYIREVFPGYPKPFQRVAWRCEDDPDTWYDTRTLERIKGRVMTFAYLTDAQGVTS